MAKKKEMDKLSQEVHQALAAGMSYGKWKAMQDPVKIEPKKLPIGIDTKICAYCGCEYAPFDNRPRKYCSTRCKKLASSDMMREEYHKKRSEENAG